MGFTALVEEFRGGTLENVHYGAIAVTDETGKVIRVRRK